MENQRTYFKRVYPHGGVVYAEIKYTVEGSSSEYTAMQEKFGNKTCNAPISRDYEKADDWARFQLKNIQKYTTEEADFKKE